MKIVQANEYTVCLGDFGFASEYKELIVRKVDYKKHKIIMGNHDDYDPRVVQMPHVLGDFGSFTLNSVTFFFIRGAQSPDAHRRLAGYDWFPDEQLSNLQMELCYEEYCMASPRIVLTHTCPSCCRSHLRLAPPSVFGLTQLPPSSTSVFLNELHKAHQPKQWLFGHFHQNKSFTINGTDFQCLAELKTQTIGD